MTPEQFHEELAVQTGRRAISARRGEVKVFGVPLGNLGFFASLLIALSSGFLAFFLTAFFAIFTLLFYNTLGHHAVDYAITYKLIALPVGIVVLVLSVFFFGFLWIRQKLRGQ